MTNGEKPKSRKPSVAIKHKKDHQWKSKEHEIPALRPQRPYSRDFAFLREGHIAPAASLKSVLAPHRNYKYDSSPARFCLKLISKFEALNASNVSAWYLTDSRNSIFVEFRPLKAAYRVTGINPQL